MKANALEKIYRTTTYLDDDKGKTLWKTKPVMGAENIEYIRKDAFVEKACDAYCKACNKPSYSVPIPFCRRRCESYNNFIKNINQ